MASVSVMLAGSARLGLLPVLTATTLVAWASGVAAADIGSRSDALGKYFSHALVSTIDTKELTRRLRAEGQPKSLTLFFGQSHEWSLTLEQTAHSENEAGVTLGGEAGRRTLSVSSPLRLKGRVNNTPSHSEFRLTISDDFIYGFIHEGSKRYYIQPLRQFVKGAAPNEVVIYEEGEAIRTRAATCGVQGGSSEGGTRKERLERAPAGAPIRQELDYYAAVDYSIYQEFDYSVQDIVNTLYAITNLVEGNFDNEFNDPFYINLIPINIYVSTCPACDPWTSSADADALLDDFRGWGRTNASCTDAGKLRQLWTRRDIFTIDNMGNPAFGTVGLAYTGEEVCTDHGFQLLEYFSVFADDLRNLVTHETGHNFNCEHDYEGLPTCNPLPPYIMAPAINNSNDWSSGLFPAGCDRNSVGTINAYYPDVDCLTLSYGALLPSGDRWVDFASRGCEQDGTVSAPVNSLYMGIYRAGEGRSVFLAPGSTPEKLRITKRCNLRLSNPGGSARIGDR